MRRVSKTLAGALAVFLLTVAVVGCGGGSGDGSTSTGAETSGQSQSESGSAAPSAQKNSQEGKGGKEGQSKEAAERKAEAAKFVPKHHQDSGGGSGQYIVKGGDNSVQEFGQEADSQELNAAAVALHDFLDARAEGNWAAACDYMAKSVVESFQKLGEQLKKSEDTTCAGILESLTNPAAKNAMKAEAEKANVGSLRVEGGRSFVIYTGLDGTILAIPVTNEGGAWKVASLTGTPLN